MKMDDADLLKSLDQHASGGTGPQPATPSLECRLMRHLLHTLGDPPIRLTLWNGESVITGADHARQIAGGLRIANRATLLRLLIHPNLYFGEAYGSGAIEIEGDLLRSRVREQNRHEPHGLHRRLRERRARVGQARAVRHRR